MCFLIGATGPGVTTTGEAIIGGVSDDPYLFRTFVRAVAPAEAAYAHLGTELRYVTEHPQLAASAEGLPPPFEVEPGQPSRGVNAAGLAFTCALAIERDPPEGAANQPQSFAYLSHRLMDDCATVDEGIELLLAAGSVSPAFSVLLADVAGGLAQVEVGLFGCAVHRRYSKESPGIVVAVNCHQFPDLVLVNKPEAQLGYGSNNNGCRLKRGWELAEMRRGHLDVPALAAILGDHESRDRDCETNPLIKWWGHSICNHGSRASSDYSISEPPWGTVSAEILQPSRRTLHYCYGWPCGERAQHGDELFQSGSWGRFLAFALPPRGPAPAPAAASDVVECTTVDGGITEAGKAFVRRAGCSEVAH